MNEDFSTSSSMDSNPMGKELQVRLMNLVMGEASDFELDQLQLLMERRAEVAAYYQHLEHLHGLLCEVRARELSMDIDTSAAAEPWQLPPDRRAKVLAVLNGKDENPPAKVIVACSTIAKQNVVWSRWWAAGVVATAASVLLCLMFLPSVQSRRTTARTSGSIDLQRKSVADSISPNVYYAEPSIYGGTSRSRVVESTRRNFNQSSGGSMQSAPSKRYVQPSDSSISSIARGSPFYLQNQLSDAIGADRPNSLDDYAHVGGKPGEKAYDFDVGQRGGMEGTGMGVPSPPNSSSIESFGFPDPSELALQYNPNPVTSEVSVLPVPNVWEAEAVQSYTVNVADAEYEKSNAGAIKLGKDNTNSVDASSTLMTTITPKFIIPEGEVELRAREADVKKELGNNLNHFRQRLPVGGESQMQERTARDMRGDSLADVSKQLNGDTFSLDEGLNRGWYRNSPGPTRLSADDSPGVELELDQVALQNGHFGKSIQNVEASKNLKNLAPDLALSDANSIYDTRVKDSIGDGPLAASEFARQEMSHGAFAPAPTPKIASYDRGELAVPEKPAAPKQAEAIEEQTALSEAFSTFSLHVSDVSFTLAQTALSQGQWPRADKIRVEEFVNALDYHDPLPRGNQKVACRVEQAIHPFLMQRNLLRVSMRTAATGRSQNTRLRLTLLLDNSGSMERPDRRQAVLRAFQTLTSQLSAEDQVTLISFASTPRLLAEKVPGNQRETLLQLIENLPSEGGTNIEAALFLAGEKAAEQQLAGAQNRIVLLTDGAVNLGDANPDSLAKLVTQIRDAGIAFDAAGISTQDLNDEVLEALTRQGDGRYYVLNSTEAAGESFAAQIAGALHPSAKNVKVQVEFNPLRVGHYKLLGFEKHRLNKEDFRNDQVDAAEMAAAEAGVAVYQFETKPNGSGDVGSVSVRFRDLSTGQMIERRWPIPFDQNVPRLEQAEMSMQLAAAAALFAAKLSGGPRAESVDLAQLQKLLSNLSEQCANQPRVQQLKLMIEQAKAIGN